jgi:hypothetical protein
VDYTIPFSRVASIVVPGASTAQRVIVVLRSGQQLRLERGGDLHRLNAGILVFVQGDQQPGYVPWADVKQVDFDR